MMVGRFALQPETPRKMPICVSNWHRILPDELTKVSYSIVLVIRRQEQPSERNGRIQHHPRHSHPRPIRTPCHPQRPDDAKQIRRSAEQKHNGRGVPQGREDDLNKICKRVDGRAAAQEHQSVDPELPAETSLYHFAQGEGVRFCVASVAFYSVEDCLEFLVCEGGFGAGGEQLVGKWKGGGVTDKGKSDCYSSLNTIDTLGRGTCGKLPRRITYMKIRRQPAMPWVPSSLIRAYARILPKAEINRLIMYQSAILT